MANYVSDDAVCLRVTDFSETSQIVTLLTRRGLVPLIAKGVKRESKKGVVSGPLDLLTSGEVVFVPAKGMAELGTLAGWELADHRNGLRADLAGLNAAMVAAAITTMLVHPNDSQDARAEGAAGGSGETLLGELEAALALFVTSRRLRGLVAYLKAAVASAGYAPHLDGCVACGKAVALGMPVRFSSVAGGIVCEGCPAGGRVFAVAPAIALALARLPAPTALMASAADRPADPAALFVAAELLVAHIECVTDKAVKIRYLLPRLFDGVGLRG